MATIHKGTHPTTVLVIDDDPAIGKLLKHNLEDRMTRVITSTTGLGGLRELCEEHVDKIILDVSLPDFNGWGILCLLRLTDSLRHIPVVITSAELPDASLMARLTPEDYISKPFDVTDLRNRLIKARVAG